VLAGGFEAVEGDAAALFPRWTDGAGVIALHSGGAEPLTAKLTFFDHRPAALRDDRPVVLVNGTPLPDSAIERVNFTGDGEGWTYQFTISGAMLRDRRATITLKSTPWNPSALGVGDRDEALGLFVHNVEVWRLGQPWAVRDDASTTARRTIPALPAAPQALYDWFNAYQPFGTAANGTIVHQAVDHWAWYLAVGGLPRGLTIGSMLSFGLLGAAIWLTGLALFLRTLPAGALRRALPRLPRARRARRRARRSDATG
jgi:hypothetical protein